MISNSRPILVLVNGLPGSGKTTLARCLGDQLRLLHLSRDRIREAMAVTAGMWHAPTLKGPSSSAAVAVWMDAIRQLLTAGASVIAEQLFPRNAVHQLAPLIAISRCVVLETATDAALARYLDRMREDPLINHALRSFGFESPDAFIEYRANEAATLPTLIASANDTGLPTLVVDTTDGYDPDLDAIADFVLRTTG